MCVVKVVCVRKKIRESRKGSVQRRVIGVFESEEKKKKRKVWARKSCYIVERCIVQKLLDGELPRKSMRFHGLRCPRNRGPGASLHC
jgi:hypothetical protein